MARVKADTELTMGKFPHETMTMTSKAASIDFALGHPCDP
jgi:hypothetical protein